MPSPAQMEANRQNAQHSTGPRTEEGKAASSCNNFKHGFCGTFTVLDSESQDDFDVLLAALRLEHSPSTVTENILVDRLAQHFWLGQRAQLLQTMSFSGEYDSAAVEKSFALYLRYQTANDRAFSKCLHDLIKIKAEVRRQESHKARLRVTKAKAEKQELDNDIKSTVQARLPGHTAIPFRLFKQVLACSIEQFVETLDRDPKLAKIMKAA